MMLKGTERDAMGDDNYHPLSRKGSNLTAAGGIGYTIVDSLDTMLIMGLDEEYQRARFWVANNMSFDRDATFNTFEVGSPIFFRRLPCCFSDVFSQTTIRVLGGLLSAYHLSGEDPIYLQRARELADRMLPAFDTPSGYPLTNINLGKRQGSGDPDLPGLVSTAEIATLQLEFRYLSHLTDDETYWRKVEQVSLPAAYMRSLLDNSFLQDHGIYQLCENVSWTGLNIHGVSHRKDAFLRAGAHAAVSIDSGHFVPSAIRLGSRGDSFYEYLLYVGPPSTPPDFSTFDHFRKQHLQTVCSPSPDLHSLTLITPCRIAGKMSTAM
jgi:hypothetical protein